ncbi:MAG: 1-acyl-sn-glycerol-3-phosphate acyltransferase [Bacteroidales bacterium]|nr:1-acyl-sn-glycerol-3-phosphate acyltransferase [Bacteroidales bacterium]
MKIKVLNKTYDEVMGLPRVLHKYPGRPSFLLHTAMRAGSTVDLKAVGFTYESIGLKRAGKGPWFVLMNHCSFLDFEILSRILYPKPYHIVATSDGFVGKEWLMRSLGCIPTQKFVRDAILIKDMNYALNTRHETVVLYPEASYSFDGTTTPLPERLSRLFKTLKVPVVMITTYGSFTRDPLYNNLQKRKVKVSAKVECLFTPEEIADSAVEDMDARLKDAFSLDYFRWQKENEVRINEPFRADSLNRVLYRCPACYAEGETDGKGDTITCHHCGKTYTMDEFGTISSSDGVTEFPHIPDWYAWERECVKKDIQDGRYALDLDVDICMMVDFKAIYRVGTGTLHHDINGFVLEGCDGRLHYERGPLESYSVYSDFFWYELGDVVCIGDRDKLFYCFPRQKDVVAKVRLATEEIYKIKQGSRRL